MIDKVDIKITNFLDHLFFVLRNIPARRHRIPIRLAHRQIKRKFAKRKSIAEVGFESEAGNINKLINSPPKLENSKIAPNTSRMIFVDLILLSIIEII